MATAELTLTANIEGLRKQLESIKDITADQAAAMASQLNKSIKSAENASKKAAAASKAAAEQAKETARQAAQASAEVGDRIGKVGEASAKLRGSLSLLGGPLGEAAGLINDIADAGEVAASTGGALVPVMAAVGAAVGAASLAYAAYAREQAQAEEQAQLQRQINQELIPTINAVRDAQLDLMVATGELTEAQRRIIGNAVGVQDAMAQLAAGQADQRREARAAIDANEGYLDTLRSLDVFGLGAAGGTLALADSLLGFSDKAANARDTLAKLDAQVVTEASNQKELRKALDAGAEATEKNRTSTERATKARQAAADASRALEEQERRVLDQNAAYLASLRDLEEAARAATEARLTGEAAVEAQLQRQVEKINEVAARQVEASAGNAGQLATIERARIDALVALEAEAAQKIDGIHEAAHEKRLAEIEAEATARRETAQATAAASASLFGALGDLAGAAAEEQAKAGKESALALFGVQKAAALAQAAINTALAVSTALVTPPPLGPIQAAAALAAGLAQTAVIASTPPPSFSDTPGVMQMGNRGAVSLAAGDYFAAAKDPAELQRQAGAVGGGGVSILEVRLGHRVLDRSVAQTLRQGGRLSREISSRAKIGPTGHAVRS